MTAATPRAAERPHVVDSPFGARTDPWYWLRDDAREDPEVLAYLAAENAYREARLAPLAPFTQRLYDEIVGRIRQDDATVPARHNGYWYYVRYEHGREYPVYARRRGSREAAEEVLLDANVAALGHDYYEAGELAVSPDNRLLALAEDLVGRRQYRVRFLALDGGSAPGECLDNVEPDLAWHSDSRTLVYVEKHPETLLGYRVRKHVLGTPVGADPVLYEEPDPSFYLGVYRSRSGRYLHIVSQSTVSTEYRYADAADPALAFRVALPRERDHEYHIEDAGEVFVIRSNWQAPNFRVLEARPDELHERARWRERVPHRADAFVARVEVFRDFLVLAERSQALRRLRVVARDGSRDYLVPAEESACTLALGSNDEPDSDLLRYVYTSLTTPATTYDLDMRSGARERLKQEPVQGDFDPARYATELVWATARDGARVPVSLLYRRGTPQDGTAPLYQYAYGAYGLSLDPAFRSHLLSLVDRGVVYAIAHVRGGQELGRAWYDAGRLQAKRNSFTDYIDVTRFLVAGGYADPRRVVGMGGSAGGLLIAAVANLAPADYAALVAHVPFVDVVTTMLDESIPLTTNEYDEWGNPGADRATYEYMLSYSPYDNVAAQAYPALLVTTGLWDSQVQYWEPAKWVARLRTQKTDDRPLLLRVDLEAGHGGKSGRFQQYHEMAEEYAFVLHELSLAP